MGDTSGFEPWTLYGESAGLVAFALHGEPPAGEDLFEVMRAKAAEVVDPERQHLDFPVAGSVLYALGAWGLFRRTMPLEDAARLLVLADRFACTRYSPTMTPSRTHDVVEREAPGLMARIACRAGRTTRPGPPGGGPGRGRAGLSCGLHLAAVGPDRQRQEDRDDDDAADQGEADLGGDLALVEQVADRGDDVADRVDLDERLEPARQRLRRDERVRQERQREHDHHRDALHRLSAAGDGAEVGEDPGQRPAGDDA